MNAQLLTANDLHSGGVVFLTTKASWSPYISMAWVADSSESSEMLAALGQLAVDNNQVVGSFLIEVNMKDRVPRPVRYREQLRINGPSVKLEFSKPLFQEVA